MQGRRINSSLNETGRRQAEALARRLSGIAFDAIYTSSLNRTIETAAPIAAHHADAPVRSLRDLDEMSWGVHEGTPWCDQLQEVLDEMYDRWDRGEFDYQVEDGESILEVQRRGLAAVDKIVEDHEGETVLVVTHGRFLRVLLSTILEIGLERMNEIEHANTGVNVLTHCDGAYSSSLLNCTTHLDVVDSVLVE